MTIFPIPIALSLVAYKTIKCIKFYNHGLVMKQIMSPLVSSLMVLKNGLVGLTLIAFFVLSLSNPLSAETSPKQPSINLNDIESGQLLMRSGNELSSAILLSTDIKVAVAGSSSRTIVSQRFINTGETWAEGVYVFPIGKNAAVDTLKLRIGDRFISGRYRRAFCVMHGLRP
jgi:Ca-activated chloride channel family protein